MKYKNSQQEFYRLCSCGTRIFTNSTIGRHRRLGHTVPLKQYKYGDVNGIQ